MLRLAFDPLFCDVTVFAYEMVNYATGEESKSYQM